jgi:hypothetical protein
VGGGLEGLPTGEYGGRGRKGKRGCGNGKKKRAHALMGRRLKTIKPCVVMTRGRKRGK